jgi:hypothetical protein
LVLGRAVAPFFFWTFDDCFLRLAMIDPPFGWRYANESQKTAVPSRGNPLYGLSTDVLSLGRTARVVLLAVRLTPGTNEMRWTSPITPLRRQLLFRYT